MRRRSRILGSLFWVVVLGCGGMGSLALAGTDQELHSAVDKRAAKIAARVIEWRRDFHQHPELSNREFRTAKIVAEHLRDLGISVKTEVAHTGVVGVLKGGSAGPVVALRADMDALPVAEETGLSFASTAKAEYNGSEVGVMHACGHDTHIAILMGAAQVLAEMRDELPGTVKFVFQPAEEGAPAGERGGASLMVEQGALNDPRVDAIFGLHAIPEYEVGQVAFKPEGMMASSDRLRIVVHGRQSHGAKPWLGIDPIVVASQIVTALQTIPSRQVDVTLAPAIVTIGSIHGGVRYNIIPDEVEMLGTIRTFDSDMQLDIHRRIKNTVEKIAESAGAKADVEIIIGNPVTYNDPALTEQMTATIRRVVGDANTLSTLPQTWAEDFAFYQKEVPGLYLFLGVRTPGADRASFPSNHSPRFRADEAALVTGVRVMSNLAIDYLLAH